MKLFVLLCLIAVVSLSPAVRVDLKKRSTIYLPYSYQSGSAYYELKKIAAEQIAYDSVEKIVYAVGDLVLHAIDVSDPDNMKILSYLEYPGMEFTDVEVCGGHVFTAIDNRTDRAQGKAVIFSKHDRNTNSMQEVLRVGVGSIPDMVKPTPDCSKLLVAVEAEAYEHPPNQITDPPGRVVIINFPWGIPGNYILSELGFDMYNDMVDTLRPSGVRHVYQENNNPFSNDVEPEYIALSADNSEAYVVLQENNAIAKVNMENQVISGIYGLGFKDWTKSAIDTSDRDSGINLRNYNIRGVYMPDAMVSFMFGGEQYLAMANEGDAKEYDYGTYQWTEEVRGKNLNLLDLWRIDAATRQQVINDTLLGRLQFSSSPAGRWPDNSYRDLYTFGARSWSIRRASDLSLVYDSGDDIATWTRSHAQEIFNSQVGDLDSEPYMDFDQRSDNKGAEPEGIEVGMVDGHLLVFVANERPGSIMVYSVDTDLTQPMFQDIYTGIPQTRGLTWKQLYEQRLVSDLDVEDLKFVAGAQSPTGKPILLAAGSVSGTVTILDVDVVDVV